MTSILDPMPPADPMQKLMVVAKDSTLATASGIVAVSYGMGFAFTLFGAMISTETTTQTMGAKDFFKYNLRSARQMGRSFAYFGLLFGGIEVALEKRRGRKDKWNPTISGGLLGGAYGWRYYKGPGLAGGVVAGAGFSLVLEALMDWMGFGQR